MEEKVKEKKRWQRVGSAFSGGMTVEQPAVRWCAERRPGSGHLKLDQFQPLLIYDFNFTIQKFIDLSLILYQLSTFQFQLFQFANCVHRLRRQIAHLPAKFWLLKVANRFQHPKH